MKKRKQRIIKGSRQDDRHEKKERMHQRAKKADAIAKKRIKKEKGSAEQKTAPLMLPVLSTERSPVEGREEAPVAKHIESDFSEKKQDGKKVKNFQIRPFFQVGLTALLLLIAALVILSLSMSLERNGEMSPDSEQQTALVEEKFVYVRADGAENGRLSTPEIYHQCAPTVVSILAEKDTNQSVGSGFILSDDGFIATANHVIDGASQLTVILSSGEERAAELVAGDSLTDLAVLKIMGEGLPTVTFASSKTLLAGERVVAIGTPVSELYAGSVCSGEVSFPNRKLRIPSKEQEGDSKTMTLIQTDAPLNRGNSGCPLFDGDGCVVGVVTMKLADPSTGICFAIPSDGAFPILQAMMRGDFLSDELLFAVSIPTPKLGVFGEAAREGELYGIRIVDVAAGTSAAESLRVGDLIIRVGAAAVTSVSELQSAIGDLRPNDTVAVTVWRGGQILTFDVTLTKG